MPARDRPERTLIQVPESALNFVLGEPAFETGEGLPCFCAERGIHANPNLFDAFYTQVPADGLANCANASFQLRDEIISASGKITFELDPAFQVVNVAECCGFPCH